MSGRGYAGANALHRLRQRKRNAAQEKTLARVMELEAKGSTRLEASAQAMHETTGAPLEMCRAQFETWMKQYEESKPKPVEA